jgi:hypothetical protein
MMRCILSNSSKSSTTRFWTSLREHWMNSGADPLVKTEEERLLIAQMSEEHRAHHEGLIKLADDALDEAQQAIERARERLRIAVRNYEERMRVPRP